MFKPMHIKMSFTVFTIIALFILAGRLDAEESNPESYCDMVQQWEADKARGVAMWDRQGVPPFRGACTE